MENARKAFAKSVTFSFSLFFPRQILKRRRDAHAKPVRGYEKWKFDPRKSPIDINANGPGERDDRAWSRCAIRSTQFERERLLTTTRRASFLFQSPRRRVTLEIPLKNALHMRMFAIREICGKLPVPSMREDLSRKWGKKSIRLKENKNTILKFPSCVLHMYTHIRPRILYTCKTQNEKYFPFSVAKIIFFCTRI